MTSVISQPQSGGFGGTKVPPGLENLQNVNQLVIHQSKTKVELITSWVANNNYTLKDHGGRTLFQAAEDTSTCMYVLHTFPSSLYSTFCSVILLGVSGVDHAESFICILWIAVANM